MEEIKGKRWTNFPVPPKRSEHIIPALIDALKDDNVRIRLMAINNLSGFGPKAEKAVPALINALYDKNSDVRARAAGSLGCIGPKAQEAIPALINALHDHKIRKIAVDALNNIVCTT